MKKNKDLGYFNDPFEELKMLNFLLIAIIEEALKLRVKKGKIFIF
jgi:hypothetical protein